MLTADQSVLYSWYNTLYAVNLDSPPAVSPWPTFGRDAQRTGDSTRRVPPLIVLTRPLEDATILVGESLDLVAAAAPGGAPITNVTFYAGDTFLAGLDAAPYSMSWSNPPVGIHRLTATVTDLRGLTSTSAPVVVTVDTRLGVSLTRPRDGAVLFQPVEVLFEVALEEVDARVTNVVFRAGDLVLGEVHTPPFRFTWTNAPVGDHLLTAVASDALGAGRHSAPISVTIHPADALVAVDDAFDVAEDTPRTVAVPGVKANDINRNPGVALVELVDPPVHGTLTLNSDGSFHYLPSTNYFGPDQFDYRLVWDDRPSAPATVHLTILAMSDVPVALGDSISRS